MILGGTVAGVAVQGVTTPGPADISPQLGFGAVGNGKAWVTTPGVFNGAISALGTLPTGTTILDWTQAGIYTFTAYAGSFTISFTNAGNLTPSLGQTIQVVITGAGSASPTWPSSVTWVGAASASAPTLTGNVTIVYLTCVAVGSSPTIYGFYLTN